MAGKVVSKMGETVQARGILYKLSIQSLLLYGSDSWVVTGDILKVMEVFHNRVERSITGMTARHMTSGKW